jgi:hypothetical protein
LIKGGEAKFRRWKEREVEVEGEGGGGGKGTINSPPGYLF